MEAKRQKEENRDLIGHRDAEVCNDERDTNATAEPPCSLKNAGKTTAAYIAFFGGGIGNAIIGATLLHLRLLTHTSVENVASLFTWRAIGCLCGNLFVAATFDRSRPEAILAFASFMVGAMNLCVPWCDHFMYLAVVMALQGLAHGMLGGGCNGYVVSTWRLRSPPFLHFLQFITSFGSAITPFMVDFFVTTDLSKDTSSDLDQIVFNSTGFNASVETTGNVSFEEDEIMIEEHHAVFYEVVYPYSIAGVVMLIACGAFLIMLIVEIKNSFKKKKISQELRNSLDELGSMTNIRAATEKEKTTVHRNASHIVFTVIVIAFCVVYGGMECTYGGFILTFVVEYLGASFETATMVSTAYWGALASGRAMAVILAKFFKPHHMIIGSLTLSTASIVTLTFACDSHILVSLVCSALIGLSFAPLFGNVISFSQKVIPVTGRETSLFVVGLYMGFVGTPAVVGFLFTKYSPILLLYVMMSAAIVACALFAAVLVFAKNCVKDVTDHDALEKSSLRNKQLDKIKSIEMLTSKTSLT